MKVSNQFSIENLSIIDYFLNLMEPIQHKLSDIEKGKLIIGETGTVYSRKIADSEGFFRILWGYSAYYIQNAVDDFFYSLLLGIKEGTNPHSVNYWGDLTDTNQLMVEMAPLSFFLIMHEEKVKEYYDYDTLTNLFNWLNQINNYQPCQNNWLFFRVLVNRCLNNLFFKNKDKEIKKDLEMIDSFYIGDGWYYDGHYSQKDYYISFAFHFYSLLDSVICKDKDPERSKLYKERAGEFAKNFQYWFDKEGRGLPFGRSLTYRFAQSCFWSAMIFAEVETYPVEYSKYFLEKNLAYWMRQPICDNSGLMTIGYTYPNLIMSEEYNGPGSPYWALKTFLILGISKNHKFWTIQPSYPNNKQASYLIEKGDMLVETGKASLQAFPIRQGALQHINGSIKYSKYVYSTNFGFNISRGGSGLNSLAFDNSFSLSEGDEFFKINTLSDDAEISEEYVIHNWRPWKDVSIKTIILPSFPWHLRYHIIETERNLQFADAGFSVPDDIYYNCSKSDSHQIVLESRVGTSAILKIASSGNLFTTKTLVNTNILYNKAKYPYIIGDLSPGRHTLCHLFYGDDNNTFNTDAIPDVWQDGEELVVLFKNGIKKKICIR
ncbi:DUF2264 domain-containing protein [Vagococcus humatus]|uniref:DUF2264 domain-containing protein n=1 Tax=Vagococcus humatus TaxID=1889241 RepID=A0A3S0AD71_9ENTE|nr:DUF2264 domain-containing protein [Vagococcus humatus]RST89069.1 hypothetical protein C7P63_07205 [Vagococcus humatus]